MATAEIRKIWQLGFLKLGFLMWLWIGKVGNEEEKERSGVKWVEQGLGRGLKGEQSSID